jgi:hypothetical protein
MQYQKGQIVLVDTNIIIEAHRTKCWKPICDFYHVETVEKCVEETQTGANNRMQSDIIDYAQLKQTLKAIHHVTELQRAEFLLTNEVPLDAGERDLLAHAATRKDIWILCSPDKAAMRAAHKAGWLDQLVSLEAACKNININSKELKRNYTEEWHVMERTKLRLG